MLAFVLAATVLAGCSSPEKEAAIAEFRTECDRVQKEADSLDALIGECEALIDQAAAPYDPDTLTALETATTDARTAIQDLPVQPGKTEEIISATKELKQLSYADETVALTNAKADYETSVKIMEQITNPDEAFVIACLQQVEGITGYAAATEDNDPNGQLHKQGGYTSAVYFSYEKVNQNEAYGNTIIEKGTDCGGQIEVYATAEDAERRSEYLGSFDGTALSSGSHTVLGTILIRTSNLMTATQQKELEATLIEVFTTLRDSK
ncbi:MAG: EbhA [Oscillospiraceae bacterium]|nr:EbhA [Oscillospiraceae bacterium]